MEGVISQSQIIALDLIAKLRVDLNEIQSLLTGYSFGDIDLYLKGHDEVVAGLQKMAGAVAIPICLMKNDQH